MELVRPKCLEDNAEVLQVFSPGGAIYEYVVKKHKHEPAQKGAEHVVHQSLESHRCIGKTERHDQELKMAMVSAEHRLDDVIGVHPHLVVARAQIELGEEASPMKLVEKLIDDRNREFVIGRLGVEGPVVDAKSLGVVRLAHQ